MSDFKVGIQNGYVKILCGEILPETDIEKMLEFNEFTLEELYQTHAAVQARWEQITINLKDQFDRFKDEFEQKWWAYNKKFAKLVLIGYGDKTLAAGSIKDMAINIYSNETTQLELDKYAYVAHQEAIKKTMGFNETDLEGFKGLMYKYINMNPPWYFETVLNTSKTLEKNFLTFQNIAKRLDNRSYHMKDLKDLTMQRMGNIGPMSNK